MLNPFELRRIMSRLSERKAKEYLPLLQAAMTEFDITTYLREAAFLAQLAHESGQLKYFEEIANGSAYEGRRDLGNVQPGDGRRYKGRGPIQLTGRANYRRYGRLLGLDLEGNPKLAATPQVGFRIAGAFWKTHGLNELADRRAFTTITRRVNGGVNGLHDRLHFYRLALAVLSQNDPVPDPDASDPEKPVNVFLRGGFVSSTAFLRDGAAWAPLRTLADALGITIAEADGKVATLNHEGGSWPVPLEIRGRTGFSPVREVVAHTGLNVHWDAATQAVELEA